MLLEPQNRLNAIRGLSDHLDVVRQIQQGSQSLTHDGVIVNDQHADCILPHLPPPRCRYRAGAHNRITVPAPGELSMVSVPPIAAARSFIPVKPKCGESDVAAP